MLLPEHVNEIREDHRRDSRRGERGWASNWPGTQLPVRFRDWTWDDVDRGPTSEPYVRAAMAMFNGFAEHWQTGIGMTFIGRGGTGKTTAACTLGVELARLGWVVRYTTMAGWLELQLELIPLGFHQNDPEKVEIYDRIKWRLDEIKQVAHLLIVDDVGHEHRSASGFSDRVFENLLRARADAGLPTVLTSNLPPQKWDSYSETMLSFLHEAAPIVSTDTREDLRLRGGG